MQNYLAATFLMERAGMSVACSINQHDKLIFAFVRKQKKSSQGAETKLNFRCILLVYLGQSNPLHLLKPEVN
jgi:hypothetical protein